MLKSKPPRNLLIAMEVILGVFAFTFLTLLYLVVWILWCYVLPAIWAAGPPGFINPGFLTFSGVVLLLQVLSLLLMGRSK